MKKIFFSSTDSLRLCGVWHFTREKTDKAIVLTHGISVDKDEDNNNFVKLANLLTKNRYAVFRFDFRGSGESDGDSKKMTVKGEVNDLSAAIQEVKKNGFSKIGLLGSSFGGGVAILYTATNPCAIDVLCLWNPVLNYEHTFLKPTIPWVGKLITKIRKEFQEKGWSTIGSRKFPIGKQLFEEMETIFPYQELKKIFIPTLVIHSNIDDHVPCSDSQQYVKNLKNGWLIILQGVSHGFSDNDEEFNKASQPTKDFFLKYLK